jgi:hypothetical protein
MVAALFRKAGCFFGDRLIPPSPANPYGYYEDFGINACNAAVIEAMLAVLWGGKHGKRCDHPVHSRYEALWLAAPKTLPDVAVPSQALEEMQAKFARRPFCFKDPRFSVTLPAWRPHLPVDCRFLVVFRDAHRCTDSIMRDAGETYSPPLPVTPAWAYLQWYRNYRRLLDDFSREGAWLFVHYDDVLSGAAIHAIERFTDASVDPSRLNPEVSRARYHVRYARLRQAQRCAALYARLCARAKADLAQWSGVAGAIAGVPDGPGAF